MDEITMTPTIDEATKWLNEGKAKLSLAESTLKGARGQYEQVTSMAHELSRTEVEQAAIPELEKTEDEAIRIAETAHANARTIWDLTSRTQFDLSTDEYREADAKRTFIRENCEDLPADRLVDAVTFALLKNDRAALYCYAKYVPARLAYGEKNTKGEWGSNLSPAVADQLRKLMGEIDAKLKDPSLAPINARAAELMSVASKLRNDALKRRSRAKSYAFQSPNEVSW